MRIRVLISFLALLLSQAMLPAQNQMLVFGKISNPTDDNRPVTDPMLTVYAYNTVAEAHDAEVRIKEWQASGGAGVLDFGLVAKTTPELGYYEIRVYPDGALLFFYEGSSDVPCQVIPVRGRNEINVSFSLNRTLRQGEITANLIDDIVIDDIVFEGNYAVFAGMYRFREGRIAKKNSRLATQMILIDGENVKDTIEYRTPFVLDGEEYHTTQLRRMNFDGVNDPMLAYADSTRERLRAKGKNYTLDENFSSFMWRDSVFFDDPDKFVLAPVKIWLEDYNRVYFTDTVHQDTRRTVKKMRFLEYDLQPYQLNPDDPEYRRRARRTKVDDARDLSLNFLVNSARLDPSDTLGARQLAELREDLSNILRLEGEGYTLKTLFVSGTSSPEGNYEKNRSLARQRMNFLSDQLVSMIPRARKDRMVMNFSSKVASWDDVADLLEADSLKAEAAQVREIVRRNPGRFDAQNGAVRNLPFYKTLISDRLPKLRTVKVEYNYEVFRELTPAEILDRYRNDPSYTAPGTVLPLYEYHALFKIVKDTTELEDLCRKALVAAEKSNDRWPLPASILSCSLISRGVADTTVLAPYIDYGKRCNQPWTDLNTGMRYTVNPAPVVANQIIMMLKAKKFLRAVRLASMKGFPTDYEYLRIIARCLAGYKVDQHAYDVVCETSARNRVVMALAMGYLPRAKRELDNLDAADPVTHYLKAQYLCQAAKALNKGKFGDMDAITEQPEAIHALVKAFRMDPSLQSVAAGDAWIFEDLYEEALRCLEDPSKLELEYVIY